MWRYFELLSFRPLDEVRDLRAQVTDGMNPRDAKFQLAGEIVQRFHSRKAAKDVQTEFVNRFQKGQVPVDMQDLAIDNAGDAMPLANLIKAAGVAASTSEALRLVTQGAVRLDGQRVSDKNLKVEVGRRQVLQVGKRRFAGVTVS